ncbi:hypothetical protein MMC07_006643 [Pseudocyphellaria aurata]|nr:hypothetical protein [Pseudocyphellaria aurata]
MGSEPSDKLPGQPLTNGTSDQESLTSKACDALRLGTNWAFDHTQPDGHWVGECRTNPIFTAEWIFLRLSLGLDLKVDGEAFCKFFWSEQNLDGSWGLAPGYRGDVSTTTEAYLALKILGVSPDLPAMRRAREFMLAHGGVAKVRVFTRFYLATFGLFPWDAVPQLPAELVLLPPQSPINIYNLSSWARLTMMPCLIIAHHQPIFALPNGKSADNDFLDELWCDPKSKKVPYAPPLRELWKKNTLEFGFTVLDSALYWLGGLRRLPYLRRYARRRIVEWILEREDSGCFGGYTPPMQGSILALVLEGYSLDHPSVRRGIDFMEGFSIRDEIGKRMQATVSPVWDTVLMAVALCDARVSPDDERLTRSLQWVKDLQILDDKVGDWQIYNPGLMPGGYAFQYINNWYPDVDDTAVAILAFVKHDPQSVNSRCVADATEWMVGMQNRDGGWGSFDSNNDHLYLNKIPFGDMNSLCDPSTVDVTGRIVDALGLLIHNEYVKGDLRKRLTVAAERGINFIAATQESTGAWWGRWGSNYLYGTSNVMCGLGHFAKNNPRVQEMACRAVSWLRSVQNVNGGWGEDFTSYEDANMAGLGVTTPSQTAWALMSLLAHVPPTDEAIQRGISYLVRTQTEKEGQAARWPTKLHTATGFPLCLWMGYDYYDHYFPMMALGRYAQKMGLKRLQL